MYMHLGSKASIVSPQGTGNQEPRAMADFSGIGTDSVAQLKIHNFLPLTFDLCAFGGKIKTEI